MDRNEIIVTYGSDIFSMAKQILNASNLADLIADRSARIGLKPNLVVAQTPDTGATTHTEIVCAVIEYLQENGFQNIIIIESAWVGDSTQRAFKVNGYDRISARYKVPLVDVKQDRYVSRSAMGITMEISRTAMDLDFLISLPVLKGHGQTLMTCALKNQKGILSDRSKRMFHALGLDDPIAALNTIRHADFVLVDSICGDLDFEEGGTPVQTNRMFACMDPVLCDVYGASLMGYEIEDIGHLEKTVQQGIGLSDLSKARISTLTSAENANCTMRPTGRARSLERYTNARSACSACYGNLIHALKKMEDDYDDMSLFKKHPVCIGQEFRGREDSDGIGVGACTCRFARSVKGCPPSANEILNFLRSLE